MDNHWKFYKGSLKNGFSKNIDDSSWEDITIPHTWNNIDGQDGKIGGKGVHDTDYFRGDGWYRKQLTISLDEREKLFYLRFEGANMQAEVYVNERKAGEHRGGYTAFTIDITPYIIFGCQNLIAVKVNNEKTEDIAPLSGDFTFYGGLYRDVELILKNEIHFMPGKYSSKGIKITTPSVSKEHAVCLIESTVVNKSNFHKDVIVNATIRSSHTFMQNPYIVNTDCSTDVLIAGNEEYRQTTHFSLKPNTIQKIFFTFEIPHPHLWNGREDPYLYDVGLTLILDEKEVDTLYDRIGFRFFSIDRKMGFFLNGQSYPLRGVSRHQDRESLGNALTKKEHDEDFSLIYDMGATAVRLAHYPQSEYFYEMCDQYGIVVWAEIPLVNEIGGSGSYDNPNFERKRFFEVTKQQLKELIEQNFNHPSIVCWGLQNEVQKNYNKIMIPFMKELCKIGRENDPYRFLTQATATRVAYNWESDLICWNIYPGWYNMRRTQLGSFMDKKRCRRPVGISEYGAGGNHNQHEERPRKVKHNGQWHPEEYQTLCHEAFLKSINKRPYLWATFVWNMFDFGSDGRNEGARPGMNDKGLVSFDRKVKKDSYFVYQSNWSKNPMVQIGESRNKQRKRKCSKIKVYSNCDIVTLYNNDQKIQTKLCRECHQKGIFVFKVKWHKGKNVLHAVAIKNDKTYDSTAEFTY